MSDAYPMRKHRESIGLSLKDAAAKVGSHWVNLHRIESGKQPPKRELARKLYALYDGAVPLAAIHDPEAYLTIAARKAKARRK